MTRTFLAVVVALYVILLAPLVVIVAVSFNAGTVTAFPPIGWSLRWYLHALEQDLYVNSIITSSGSGWARRRSASPWGSRPASASHAATFRGATRFSRSV